MPTFQAKPYGKKGTFDPLAAKVKKRPFILFGLPFIAIIVGGSFGLSQLTQTRYDHRDMRHKKVKKLLVSIYLATINILVYLYLFDTSLFFIIIITGCQRRSIRDG